MVPLTCKIHTTKVSYSPSVFSCPHKSLFRLSTYGVKVSTYQTASTTHAHAHTARLPSSVRASIQQLPKPRFYDQRNHVPDGSHALSSLHSISQLFPVQGPCVQTTALHLQRRPISNLPLAHVQKAALLVKHTLLSQSFNPRQLKHQQPPASTRPRRRSPRQSDFQSHPAAPRAKRASRSCPSHPSSSDLAPE